MEAGRNRVTMRLLAAAGMLCASACAGSGAPREGAPLQSDSTPAAGAAQQTTRPAGTVLQWLGEMRTRVGQLPDTFAADPSAAQRIVLELYVNRQEYLELYYGANGTVSAGGELGAAVTQAETLFHTMMARLATNPRPQQRSVRSLVDSLDAQLASVARLIESSGVPVTPPDSQVAPVASTGADREAVGAILARLEEARALHSSGRNADAQRIVEDVYLQHFEPLEPLLPISTVGRIEELIHLRLRPGLESAEPTEDLDLVFASLLGEMRGVQSVLASPRSAWFGFLSSFLIIVREGLEAILLIAAIVAYVARTDGGRRYLGQVWGGVGAGIAASLGTWLLARSILPITGAGRELLEGITALIAVAVLLYVSHWIFQKSYVQDWKRFMESNVQRALTAGSAFAMVGLSFAAVYREGFETVLFYQALLVDLPAASVGLGFAAGALLIVVVGYGIVKLGLRLPLRRTFLATNVVLLFLSVVILGKGLYNLQEAGLFAPTHLSWLPNSEVLRQILGFYPIAETLLAQLGLLTLVLVMYLVYRRRRIAFVRGAAA